MTAMYGENTILDELMPIGEGATGILNILAPPIDSSTLSDPFTSHFQCAAVATAIDKNSLLSQKVYGNDLLNHKNMCFYCR